MESGLQSPLGELVRRVDKDRWFTVLFAPPPRRDALLALYAFNHELARAREVVREPFAALIRLQWWRDVVEGARRQHEVAAPLGAALDAGLLDAAELERLVSAREAEAEGFATLAEFEAYAMAAAGGVMVAAGRALGMGAEAEALRRLGAAYGVAGVLRSVAAHARQGRCLLPLDLVQAAGSSEGAVIANPADARLEPVHARLREAGRGWLQPTLNLSRPTVAAALPAVLARRDLGRRSAGTPRPVSDRLAVVAAVLRGRI